MCFAILRPGYEPSNKLREEIKDAVAEVLGKPMRPEAVKFTKDIPKTRNTKIMRRLIRAKYLGAADLGDMTGLENPNAIEEIGGAVALDARSWAPHPNPSPKGRRNSVRDVGSSSKSSAMRPRGLRSAELL